MLTSIHIKGFKGFKDTQIEPLRKVNVVLGGQNVGKTSLLEAVYFGATDIGQMRRLPSVFRLAEGHDTERFMQTNLKDTKGLIELIGGTGLKLSTCLNRPITKSGLGQLVHSMKGDGIEVEQHVDDSLVNAIVRMETAGSSAAHLVQSLGFANPLAVSVHLPDQKQAVQLFDRVVMTRKKRRLLDMLQRIEPRLEDMHSLSPDGELRIYVELDGEAAALPLPQLGHGFSRLVYLYCSLLVTEAKLALIDEIENGIHYSSLPTLFQGIQDIAIKHDVQTMMTTHSWECIRAAYNVFADAGSLKDFQLVRLERDGDNIRAVVISDENLVTVMEAGYEVR
jgi:hypothetical protein